MSESNSKEMSRRDVAVGYLWNFLFSLINRLVFPIVGLLLYRVLGPVQVGIFALLGPGLQVLETIRDAGVALTFIADRSTDKDRSREAAYAGLAIGSALVFAGLILAFRGPLATFFANPIGLTSGSDLSIPDLEWGFTMLAVGMVLNGFSTIPANKLQKHARFRDAGLADFAAGAASLAVAVTLALMGFGFKALVWQFVVRAAIYSAICWVLEPTRIGWIQGAVVRQIWRQSFANLANNFLFTIYTVADTMAVTKIFGPAVGGNYNAAYQLGVKPLDFFTFPLSRTLLIAYSQRSDNLPRLASAFAKTLKVVALVMPPLYALVFAYAETILNLLIGEQFESAPTILRLLCLYFLARSIGSLSGNVLVTVQRAGLNVLAWLIGFAVVIPLFAVRWQSMISGADGGFVQAVQIITLGAVLVYSSNTLMALAVLKPQREELASAGKALLLSFLPVTGLALLRFANLPPLLSLGIAITAVPAAYMAVIGMVFVGNPVALFTPTGAKAFWKSL